MALHGGDPNHRQARGIGESRSRDAGKDHRGDHHDVAEAAPDMANETAREIPDASAQAKHVEQIAAEDEERDGQQRIAVHPFQDELRDQNQIAPH